MQIDVSKNQNFSLDYTTKSGKKLSLDMYDNQSINYSKDDNSKNLSLKREYGFSFTFEGSKLTQNELDEIKDAMKEVEPMIQNFLANSKVGELKPKDLIQSAMQMANVLPTPKDENHQNAIMNGFTNKLENLLNKNQTPNKEQNTALLEDSKKLLDEVLEQMKKQLEKMQEKAAEQNATQKDSNFDFYA
ncbi:ATP-binding protein [Campylobacter upsaliensis]|uniref:ATP-binding protein n=1 Tax=Campylobacter upsaliensis TaxID=28080 RepID=A0A5M1DTZ6_CAMUP|nr:intracellular survival protein CiaI [Campylobacter upsaliensis]EAI2901046.1 ATP-binding protein [Campylobacter upsaliensis]EAI9945143.1 ATP-binding protein [Campylobacter upsaliensis]EAK1467701.1 ATP-binding protein [Campylobacter upsaliensis]ECJ8454732.1 ATP-binding protein [Campylobacter upsaliensis]ECV9717227.1 ATP-binding protein [Campylobacter upsaliensis]